MHVNYVEHYDLEDGYRGCGKVGFRSSVLFCSISHTLSLRTVYLYVCS